ncbi:hypothetical protein [Amycolatopsis thermoflava]|uniref:hypothetical protein n=1 Tax=Amycolatopsis thermoflava TaxID=84480 RepID=UPI003EBDD23F
MVQDAKTVKNRLHIDVHVSGDRMDPIQRRSRPPGGPGRHHHLRAAAGRDRPLRGRDEGPRRERVRRQLTGCRGIVAAGQCRPLRSLTAWRGRAPRRRGGVRCPLWM